MVQRSAARALTARFHQTLLAVSMLGICWLGMMAVHEFGHVVGAWATGGTVKRVVLYPLTISRTDVSPNPSPATVVWLGPLLGCALPILVMSLTRLLPKGFKDARSLTVFFAGFCLLANGAYIAVGAFDGVGDCGVMLKTGSPFWALLAFGAVAMVTGFVFWHRLGSVKDFVAEPQRVEPATSWIVAACMIALLVAEFILSPK